VSLNFSSSPGGGKKPKSFASDRGLRDFSTDVVDTKSVPFPPSIHFCAFRDRKEAMKKHFYAWQRKVDRDKTFFNLQTVTRYLRAARDAFRLNSRAKKKFLGIVLELSKKLNYLF
jgi:hypothetical protein